MSKVLTAVVFGLAMILPGAMGASALAASPSVQAAHRPPPPAHGPCQKVSYTGGVWVKTTVPNCSVVPPGGTVTTTICGVHLVGSATPGTAVTFQCLPLLVKLCAGETGVSIEIVGTGLDLTAPGARIYMFNPATGQSSLVSAVTGNGGEYTFVFGSCGPIVLPKTGGAATGGPLSPSGPSIPSLPIGLGVLMVLIGGAMTLKTRKSQV